MTELKNIEDHSTSTNNSPAAPTFEESPAAVLQLASRLAPMDKQNNNYSAELSQCESRLNASPPQKREAVEETVVAKESLADWGVVACVFFSNMIGSLDITGFGVLYPVLVEHFDAKAASVGWCTSINGFFQAVIALFASYPIQSFGCRLPGVVGCLLFALGLSLSYFAQNLTTIYLTYGVIAGSGTGLALLSTNIIVHQRFSRNRNLASGIGWVGFSLGGIIGSFLTNYLIESYGWRGAFLLLGATQVQRIPLCLFFRTPERLRSQSNRTSGTSSRRISSRSILRYLKETFNFSILRQTRFTIYACAYFLHVFCLYGYLPHTVNRAIHMGLSSDQGVKAAALVSAMSTVTRIPVAFIANIPKVISSMVFGSGMFFAFLSIVAIFINTGLIGTMTSAALFGMHLGFTITVSTVVAVDLMGVALLPKSLSIMQFTGGLARLISAPLVGWVFDVTKDYNKAFAIIGCTAFLSSSLMVVLTIVTRCHRKKSVAKDNELSLTINVIAPPPPTPDGQLYTMQ